MGKIYMTQNDTKPDLYFYITYAATGGVVNLTGSTVNFRIINDDAPGTIVNSGHTACTLSDPTNGVCYYAWQAADTTTAGQFTGELEVTYVDTTKQTIWDLFDIEIRQEVS